MLRFLIDEDFNNKIVRALLRLNPELDIIDIRTIELSKEDDPKILAWAAQEGRIVLTHDVNTMTRYAYERIKAGEPMPGLVAVNRSISIGKAAEELLLLALCSEDKEWDRQVLFIPLR